MQVIWVISPRQPLLFCRPVLKKGPVAVLGWEQGALAQPALLPPRGVLGSLAAAWALNSPALNSPQTTD